MNKVIVIICVVAIAVVVAGFVAYSQGWWQFSSKHAHDASSVSRPAVAASSAPAMTVTTSSDLPRAQRAPSVTCTTPQKIVQFANAEVARKAGLQFVTVERRPVRHSIECSVEMAFNGDRLAHVSPRAPGVVQRVEKRAGDLVETGEMLALIESSELGAAKADHLQARAMVNLQQKNYDRQIELSESGVSAKRTLLEAETSLAEANISLSRTAQRLRTLGLSKQDIQSVAEANDTSSSLPLTAPFAGMIVERHAVQGEVVDTHQQLFTIADTAVMWAMLDIYESDVRHVKVGQPVVVQVHGLEGESFGGRITWVASSVDATTRTLKARADIDNAQGKLRANSFGRAVITVNDGQDAVVVPKSAVQWEGCCNIVFVKHTDTVFQPYKVRLGYDLGDHYVVDEGLEPGESIVTQGAFLLKTEVLKGSIGAGCCEVHGVTDAKK